jgi:tetratricopeptide (TPR) repeat protein
VELGERDAPALAAYAFYLQATGRPDDSVPLLREAQALDPLSAPLPYLLGRADHLAGRCAAALEAYDQALALDPYLRPALFASAECHSDLGHARATLEALRGDLGLAGADARALAILDARYARAGQVGLWDALCEKDILRPREPMRVARACMRGERPDLALDWLETAARERSPALISALREPMLERLRREVRFRQVLEKSGLRMPPG